MIKRLTEGIAWAKRFEDQRGQALVELAFCLPVLCTLIFGVVDFSQMIVDEHVMVGLSRQGSNIASRGMDMTLTVAGLETQGASLNLATQGWIIVTVVKNSDSGQPQIRDQVQSSTGIPGVSAVGSGIGSPATMPDGAKLALNAGETLFVTEVFYSYKPLTPVGTFLKKSLASTMYEAAYF